MQHHPIYQAFDHVSGERPYGLSTDFIGSRFDGRWDGQADNPHIANYTPPLPGFDEEYFEWIDILESVEAARGSYVFMELGAGYGRWSVRAGLAARQRGLSPQLVLVEGHPRNAKWARESLSLNGLADSGAVLERAVAYTGQPVPFVVSHHERELMYDPCVAWGGAEQDGWGTIMVETVTFEQVASSFDRIDLVDMDLQRAERELVANSMDTLNAKVKRVHIGTHLPDIEDELRVHFAKAGWRNVWDFGCNRENETPYGRIPFVDGVQSWVNPRLS